MKSTNKKNTRTKQLSGANQQHKLTAHQNHNQQTRNQKKNWNKIITILQEIQKQELPKQQNKQNGENKTDERIESQAEIKQIKK